MSLCNVYDMLGQKEKTQRVSIWSRVGETIRHYSQIVYHGSKKLGIRIIILDRVQDLFPRYDSDMCTHSIDPHQQVGAVFVSRGAPSMPESRRSSSVLACLKRRSFSRGCHFDLALSYVIVHKSLDDKDMGSTINLLTVPNTPWEIYNLVFWNRDSIFHLPMNWRIWYATIT